MRFGRNVPLRRTRLERGERLMTLNPRVVSTALLAGGSQMIPAATLNVLAAAWLQFQAPRLVQPRHGSRAPVPGPQTGDQWPDDAILLPRTPATRTPTGSTVETRLRRDAER